MKNDRPAFAMLALLLYVTVAIARTDSPTTQPTSKPAPFANEIAAFEALDRKSPPPQNAILFIGSSSIRLWKSLPEDFPDQKVINRGFGGSEIKDSTFYAPRIIVPYHPRLIILGAGTNDIHAGLSPAQVLEEYKLFVKTVREALPDVRIAFIEINPAPSRWSEHEREQEANRLVKAYIATEKNLDYIDLYDSLIGPDGKPREDLYVADKLHPNAAGYKIRADAVRPHLN